MILTGYIDSIPAVVSIGLEQSYQLGLRPAEDRRMPKSLMSPKRLEEVRTHSRLTAEL
jgi:hypothetical protein